MCFRDERHSLLDRDLDLTDEWNALLFLSQHELDEAIPYLHIHIPDTQKLRTITAKIAI